MKKSIKTAIAVSALALISYVPALIGIDTFLSGRARKITETKELERFVKEEMRNLKCRKEITVRIVEGNVAYTTGIDDNNSEIVLGVNNINDYVVRHEAYHAARHVSGKRDNPIIRELLYHFWWEPRAIIYAVSR